MTGSGPSRSVSAREAGTGRAHGQGAVVVVRRYVPAMATDAAKADDTPVNPLSGRRETEHERLDRNYEELLQELRVAQTGTQILFAFLLTVSFTPLMQQSDTFTHRLLAVAILASAGATALLIAPVAFHRLVFRRGLKKPLVIVASRLAQGGLALLLVAMLAACMLAVDAVLTRGTSVVLTAAMGLWFIAFWYLLPITVRQRSEGRPAQDGERR